MFNKKVENEDVKLTAGIENFVNKKIRTKKKNLIYFWMILYDISIQTFVVSIESSPETSIHK